eukprot:CAMPEP_0113962452 /NCGR_PEP_ID=MMETSP0011_2-20120614/5925_1 /TAXON_ID=101924 /ORGANISM="Rhodosorus marinus" /LENGTH=707 /DNA_ID=CAMNT_0000974311 /DNA_START=179 /DNA_END=2302 /DNA_ORIENTATION=+ /assembly_acc=CAM_ASM_000156
MAISEERRIELLMRKKPKSSFVEIKEILNLLRQGYNKSAYVAYMQLRRAKRKVITRPQYIYLTDQLGRHHGLHTARVVFDDMHRKHKACAHAFNTLLKVYADAGHPRKCRNLLDEMETRFVTPDATSYTILMQAWLQRDEMDEALSVYDEMVTAGVEPNSVTLEVLMKGFLAQKRYKAVLAVDESRHEYTGLYANTDALAVLIRANAALKNFDKVRESYERMLANFEEYRVWKVEEDARIAAEEEERALLAEKEAAAAAEALAQAAATGVVEHEDWESENSLEEVELPVEGRKPFYAKKKKQEERPPPLVSTIFGDVDDSELEEDFDALDDEETADEFYEDDDEGYEFDDEQDEESQSARKRKPKPEWPATVKLNDSGFVAMLEAFSGRPDEIRKVLTDVASSPVLQTVEVLNAAMLGFVDGEDLDGVRLIFDKIAEDDSEYPHLEVLKLKLRGFGALNDPEGVSQVHEAMINGNEKPDKYLMNLLVDAYRLLDRPTMAEQAFEELRGLGLKGNLGTYNILLQMYADRGAPDEAEEVLDRMTRRKLRGNTRSYNLLLQAYANAGDTDQLIPIFRRLYSSGVSANELTMGILLDTILEGGDDKRIDELKDEFDRMGVEWSEAMLEKAAKYYSSKPNPVDGLADLSERLALREDLQLKTLRPLLSALIASGNQTRAEIFVETLEEKYPDDEMYQQKIDEVLRTQLVEIQ